MAMATECMLNGELCEIGEAIRLRDVAKTNNQEYPTFTCTECGAPVRPHGEGVNGQSAHFEHRERNPTCGLSHRLPE